MMIKKLRNFTALHGCVEPLLLLIACGLMRVGDILPIAPDSLLGRILLAGCAFLGVGLVVGTFAIAKPRLFLGIPKRKLTENRFV